MNYHLNQIPDRTTKPRQKGLTMVMDKGLSLRQVEDFLETGADYTDIVKLGWATSYVTPNLKDKLALYKSAGIPVYFGGTLFEAFYIRGQFDEYRRVLDQYGMEYAEISDGSVEMESDVKCEFIRTLCQQVTVLSEVGSKDEAKIIPPKANIITKTIIFLVFVPIFFVITTLKKNENNTATANNVLKVNNEKIHKAKIKMFDNFSFCSLKIISA